jgi:hypothetical protein
VATLGSERGGDLVALTTADQPADGKRRAKSLVIDASDERE